VTLRARPEEPGCDSVAGLGDFLRRLLSGIPWSERAEAIESLHFATPPAGLLRIDNPNGRTRIRGEDREDVEAARRLVDSIHLTSHESEGALDLSVDAPRRWNRRGTVDVELLVPRTLRIEASASNGKICMEGLRAALRARSSNGAVRIGDVRGDIDVQSSNAKVHCSETCGRLVARTSNGKIELMGHRGSVDASTSNGLIHAELEQLSDGGVVLATSNGRIVLELPDPVDADVDARVDNGVIRNQRSLCRCTRSSGGRLSGRLGQGGVPVKLRTSNGSISLR
jgi:DUF4097 and DUF4098 domain-containing protein YvlB